MRYVELALVLLFGCGGSAGQTTIGEPLPPQYAMLWRETKSCMGREQREPTITFEQAVSCDPRIPGYVCCLNRPYKGSGEVDLGNNVVHLLDPATVSPYCRDYVVNAAARHEFVHTIEGTTNDCTPGLFKCAIGTASC